MQDAVSGGTGSRVVSGGHRSRPLMRVRHTSAWMGVCLWQVLLVGALAGAASVVQAQPGRPLDRPPPTQRPAVADEEDPGMLFPTVPWREATRGVEDTTTGMGGGTSKVDARQPRPAKTSPSPAARPTTAAASSQAEPAGTDGATASGSTDKTAPTGKSPAGKPRSLAEFEPIATEEQITAYLEQYDQRERRAVRPDAKLALSKEIREAADKLLRTDEGLRRFMLLRCLTLTRQARTVGSDTLQQQRLEEIVAIYGQLAPLIEANTAANQLARVEVAAATADVLSERAALSRPPQLAARTALASAKRKVEEAKARLADAERRKAAFNPGRMTFEQYERARKKLQVAVDIATAEVASADALLARRQTEFDGLDAVAQADAAAAKEQQRLALNQYMGLIRWQLTHGYIDESRGTISQAVKLARMLEDPDLLKPIDRLSAEAESLRKRRAEYLARQSTDRKTPGG